MRNYTVVKKDLLKAYIRRELGLTKDVLKGRPLIKAEVEVLADGVSELVERDFNERLFDPELLEGYVCDNFRRRLSHLARFVWKEVRPRLFDEMVKAPNAETMLAMFTAMTVTRSNLLALRNGEMEVVEPAVAKVTRTSITSFVNPRKVRNRQQLAAFLFLINSGITEATAQTALVNSKKAASYYTHMLRDSAEPACTAKQVRALFKAQHLNWQNGRIFGIDRMDPMPSELYYSLIKALVKQVKFIAS